jgi:hypothetical protein
MHPALAITIILVAGAATFLLILAIVNRLQTRKKKNSPSLDPASHEAHNLDSSGAED